MHHFFDEMHIFLTLVDNLQFFITICVVLLKPFLSTHKAKFILSQLCERIVIKKYVIRI